jgi:glycosyltransferase involved in cell wall biosynthesis
MISVVIPTLNSGKFLEATLESIVTQDFKDWEVIVVDSNSEDSTLRIVREYKMSFNGINLFSMPREGQVRAINYGMSLAKGDILTFINSDDTYEHGCFSMVDYIFKAKPDAMWLYGIGKVIDENGKITRSLVTNFKALWWQRNSRRVLSWFDYIVQPAVFWRKNPDFQFNPMYSYAFDYEGWLRMWKNMGKPEFVDVHLANWRAHKDAISVRNTDAQIDESLRINLPYAQGSGDIMIQGLVAWIEKVVYGVIG